MSRCIPAAIRELGAIPLVERSAHCFLETRMIHENCVLGFEYSGPLFFRRLGGADDGMYAAMCVTGFLRRSKLPLADLLSKIPELHITPDLRIPAGKEDFGEIRRRLRDAFAGVSVSGFDGIKVETPKAWFLVRPSVSEDKLSFRFEGETREDLNWIIHRVMELPPGHAAPLEQRIKRPLNG